MNGKDSQTAALGPLGDLIPYSAFLQTLDRGVTTGWRWRQNGVVRTVNIYGKLYVTREEIGRFQNRALAGEFHKNIKPPGKR